MDKIILENIRCFAERQEIALKPLTLLVGENSTGKTTFLAATKIVSDLVRRRMAPDFNEEPFRLGAYDQIAHFRGGRSGRAKTFAMGFETARMIWKGAPVRFIATFRKVRAQPELARYEIRSGTYKFEASIREKDGKPTGQIVTPRGSLTVPATDESLVSKLFIEPGEAAIFSWHPWHDMALADDSDSLRSGSNRRAIVTDEDRSELDEMARSVFRAHRRPVQGLAPIRSKPQRTYDPTRDIPEPTGGHVPMVMANISSLDSRRWAELKKELEKVGAGSGLFDELSVKRLGKTQSDPFQVRVKISGPSVNLVDVGYGVSQALPVFVDALMAANGATVLLQQPEVHLHPRAQAELGTFLARLVKRQQKRFVVETHSDYLIDRVRMDVREGKTLRPDEVTILFFEWEGPSVKIHPLSIDNFGNIQGAPPGYRKFFLAEERRFLGA